MKLSMKRSSTPISSTRLSLGSWIAVNTAQRDAPSICAAW
jgi:hypothetical protein